MDIKSITLNYEDGTVKEITKGVVFSAKEVGDDNMELTFETANCNGEDFANILMGIFHLIVKLELFDTLEEEI